MTAITEANAKKIIKSLPFFRQMSKHGKEGWYKFLTNFDDITGAYSGEIADTDLTGITGDSLTIASGETDGTFVLSVNTTGTNHAVTLKAPVTTQAVTLTLPDVASDTLVCLTGTQTLTNKTLTTPTIADFTNATHDHSNAAGGGAIVATGITGSTSSTFTINYGAAVETEIAITSAGTTGGFTATLAVPTLAADRTITFPAVTCTLASVTGAETLTNKTLTSPVIGTGLTASGSASNNFGDSTGAFVTSSGANTLSGDVTISGSKTLTTGTGAATLKGSATFDTTKTLTFGSASAGTSTPITMYSLTGSKGALILAVADATGNYATTLTNGDPAAAATITLPNATSTLATIGLNETFTGNKVFTGTLDIRGNVSSGASNPNITFSGSTGTFATTTGNVSLAGNTLVANGKTFGMTGNGTFGTGTGTVSINGATVFAADKGVTVTGGTSAFDFSGGSGLFKTTTGAVTIGNGTVAMTGICTFSAAPVVQDDIHIGIGTGSDAFIQWSTDDANAECVMIGLGAAAGNVVPVLVIGDQGVEKDLTFFNGTTLPTVALIDGDEDSWLKLDWSADDVARITSGGTSTALGIGATANTLTLNGAVKGEAEGYMTHTLIVDATASEINAGHTVVTVPAGRQFQLVSCKAIAYGGAVTTTTTVDLLDSATKLVAFAQASLTQSAVLTDGGAGAAVLADGASYTARTAGNDITVGKTGGDVETATGVRFIISYILI
jgi:hypothetical protein